MATVALTTLGAGGPVEPFPDPSLTPTSTTLAAILINPAERGGLRTLQRVQVAARLLGHGAGVVANLLTEPTRSVKEIRIAGQGGAGWLAARDELKLTIESSTEVLVGWGINRPSGLAGVHFLDQLSFVRSLVEASGSGLVWTVGGEARHPSRWHQYISDRHGRATGDDFEERLRSVLRYVPIGRVC